MSAPEFAYIWTEPDTLTEHLVVSRDNGDTTACGVAWVDLPAINQDELDAGYDTPDKPWYYDHNRDDVVPCAACGLKEKSR